LKAFCRTSQLTRLNTLRFINGRTEGLNKGRPTPKAHVTDNDLAVVMPYFLLKNNVAPTELCCLYITIESNRVGSGFTRCPPTPPGIRLTYQGGFY